MKKRFLFLISFLFLINFISAATVSETSAVGVVMEIPELPINVTTTSQVFNMSDWWITNEGNMDNVPDLYPTLDLRYTNASTECNQGFYLDGGGFCIHFNNTVEQLIASVEYNASNIVTTAGTLDAGDIDSVKIQGDDDWYNVSEASGGTPVLDIIINFTDITNFNSVQFSVRYDDGGGHEMAVGIKICGADYIEAFLPHIVDTSGVMARFSRNVLISSNHICGANRNVSVRLRHIQNGISSHDFFIDDIKLIQGAPVSSPVEVDPFSIHSEGDVALTGQWNVGNFQINMSNLSTTYIGSPTGTLNILNNVNLSAWNLTTTGTGNFGELQVDNINLNSAIITFSDGAGISAESIVIGNPTTSSHIAIIKNAGFNFVSQLGTNGVTPTDGIDFTWSGGDGGDASGSNTGGEGASGSFVAGDGGDSASGTGGKGGSWSFTTGAKGSGGNPSDGDFIVNIAGNGIMDFNGDVDHDGDYDLKGDYVQLGIRTSTNTNSNTNTHILKVTGADGLQQFAGGQGDDILLTAGAGTRDGRSGNIELTTQAQEDTGVFGNVILVKDGGCTLIGTTNLTRCNATDIFIVDGYSWGLGWRVDSDRSLKSEISVVDESSTRKLNKYKIQYDIPVYGNYTDEESFINESGQKDVRNISLYGVIDYEIAYTPFQHGLILDEMPEEDREIVKHCIGNKCGIDVYELASLNYKDIGKLEDEDNRIENKYDDMFADVCFEDNEKYNKYGWCDVKPGL